MLLKEELLSTIFSSSSISSACRSACMKALTATDTLSGFLHSGSAVDTTWGAGRGRRQSEGGERARHAPAYAASAETGRLA